MNYTVNKLAQLSGVSIRTLRFYDETGLLKPAYVGENGYRYYQEDQLLLLQQILFFRELGFELKQIQDILKHSDFDRVDILKSHKKVLRANISRMQKLIKTIDKTIDHLHGNYTMTEHEMYYGFSKEKQAEYENYLEKKLGPNRPELAESKQNTKGWTKVNWDKYQATLEELNKAFAQALQKGLKVNSPEVQQLVGNHFQLIKQFWSPTKESYIGLAQMYVEHPDFKKLYVSYDPKLAQYIADAMKVYAECEL